MTRPSSMDELDEDSIVVLSGSSRSNRTAHLPAESGSYEPHCGRTQSDSKREWSRREVQHLMGWREDWSLCHYCQPLSERTRNGGNQTDSELHAKIS